MNILILPEKRIIYFVFLIENFCLFMRNTLRLVLIITYSSLFYITANAQQNLSPFEKAVKFADSVYRVNDLRSALSAYRYADKLKPGDTKVQNRIIELEKALSSAEQFNKEAQTLLYEAELAFRNKDYASANKLVGHLEHLSFIDPHLHSRLNELKKKIENQQKQIARYNEAMLEGNDALKAKRYQHASKAFSSALQIKGDDEQAAQGLAQSQQQEKQARILYQQKLAEANQAYQLQKYEQALQLFTEANQILPEGVEAQQKIDEINDILTYQAEISSQYQKAKAKGDAAFAAGKFDEAMKAYKEAIDINPDETYPKTRIREIQALYADESSRQQRYKSLINEGDNYLKSGEIEKAYQLFSDALLLKPNDSYGSSKIKSLQPRIDQLVKNRRSYEQLIHQAAELEKNGEFTKAIQTYQSASKLLPDSTYPQEQIAILTQKFNEQKQIAIHFEELLKQADQYIVAKNYSQARSFLQQASELQPNNAQVRAKLAQIDELETNFRQLQANYQQAIQKADNLLANKMYNDALVLYQGAIKLKPDETYPKTKIQEIEDLFKQQQAIRNAFDEKLVQADRLLKNNQFAKAKEVLQSALEIFPNDKRALDRIHSIDSTLLVQKSIDEQFEMLLARAGEAENQKDYEQAEKLYREALALKPNHALTSQKIEESSRIRQDIALKEAKYAQTLARGDRYLSEKQYENASKAYAEAIQLKANDLLASRKKAQSDSLLIVEQNRLKLYSQTLSEAQNFFESKQYDSALVYYRQVLKIQPNDKAASARISEIENILGNLRQKRETYESNIKLADQYLATGDLKNALAAYQNALKIYPDEKYPQQKVEEIQLQLEQKAAIEANYRQTIVQANQLAKEGKWQQAKLEYQKAQAINPNEVYPSQKVQQMDSLILAKAEKEKSFNDYVARGNEAFDAQDLDKALGFYQQASQLMPGNPYPQSRIEQIKILKTEKEKAENDAFTLAKANAKNLENAGDYQNALEMYQNALSIKPNNEEVKDRIEALHRIIAQMKANELKYQQAIAKADSLYKSNNLITALTYYKEASQIKQNETYPLDQILAIETKIKTIEKREQDYARWIKTADSLDKLKNYSQAVLAYENAVQLKPNEEYPKQKITELRNIIQEIATRTEQYHNLITKADASYKAGKLYEARQFFMQATQVMPDQEYAANRLKQIDEEIQAIEQRQLAYKNNFRQADSLYRQGALEEAISFYRKAAEVNPSEALPGQKIKEIQKILSDNALLEARFQHAIKSADSCFDVRLYNDALKHYLTARNLKPTEDYPSKKIAELNALLITPREVEGITYEKALAEGKIAENKNDLGVAFDNYLIALHLEPHRQEAIEGLQRTLKLILSDTLTQITDEPLNLETNQMVQFSLDAKTYPAKSEAFIVVSLSHPLQEDAKIVVNYGHGKTKTGGVVIKLLKNPVTNTFVAPLNSTTGWNAATTTWLSLVPEQANLSIQKILITALK